MSPPTTVEYVVRVHSDDDGSLWAEVADLPGCFASGRSLDELRDALEEAISLYLADGTHSPEGSGAATGGGPRRPLRVDEMLVRVAA